MRKGAETVRFYMPPEQNDMLWKVHRENLIFFAGERALHMELLDPRIAESLVKNAENPDSGRFEKNPLKRLYETADYGLRLIFGTEEEVAAAAAEINEMHRKVHGTMKKDVGVYSAGTEYNAFDQDQMKWIAVTLLDSSLVGYETFVGSLSKEEKDRYVRQASQLFKVLHFNPDLMPSTHDEMQGYIQGRIDRGELVMGENAKKLIPYISLRHTPGWKVATQGLHTFTMYTLPPELNQEYGYELSPIRKRVVEKVAQVTQRVHRSIPRQIRHPLIALRSEELARNSR